MNATDARLAALIARVATATDPRQLLGAVRVADTAEEAHVLLDRVCELGTDYELIAVKRPRHNLIKWLPKVGEGVVGSINGDSYYEGEVTKVTRHRFTTTTGKTYRWSSKRNAWNLTGSSYFYATKGTEADERRDPHF